MFKRFIAVLIVIGILMSFVPVSAMSTYDFDNGMKKGVSYYNSGKYKEAADEFQRFCDTKWAELEPGQREYLLEYLNSAKSNINVVIYLTQAEFDKGMAKGISYYNSCKYKEAADEFQWFCDYNWGRLNSGQQKYALDYLNSAKSKKNVVITLTQTEFDKGMKKGITYYDKNMFFEARDEFQWFCDANWGKLNSGQQKYALEYLDSAKEEIKKYIYMYKYANSEVQTLYVHPNNAQKKIKEGWSYSRPVAKYEPTHKGLQNEAIRYWKDWLYWPNLATMHNIRVASTWDDWEKGILYAEVYIDGTVLTSGGYYDRKFYIIDVTFNKYTGVYTATDLDEID